MAELVSLLAFYQCPCGMSFVLDYPADETPEEPAACAACEIPGANE
ncbi:hypothetical protein [Streptomyces sp. NRRL F-2580]|nr:hypothetical protein [Streptomyces sp. NRRL F-2580]